MVLGVGLSRLGQAVDEIAALDVTIETDAAIADTFIELRGLIDRLECSASHLLATVEGRRIPHADGASSVPAWPQ
jgi:hypothetical protein